jgi:hypothetical protein
MTKPKPKSEIKPPTNVGMTFEYVKCPFCGFTHSTKRIQFGKNDPANMPFISVRQGGGWKSGFHKISEISFVDAKEMPEYIGIINDIKEQCKRILKELS